MATWPPPIRYCAPVVPDPEATVTTELHMRSGQVAGTPEPGLVVVFAQQTLVLGKLAIGKDPVTIGRESMPPGTPLDPAISRRHARISQVDGSWTVTDLGSHNGTSLDGERLQGERSGPALRVLRMGQTLCLLEPDLRPYIGLPVPSPTDPIVMGHRMRTIWRLLAQLADQPSLHIHGESGSGKELAARAFHELGDSKAGPFVAVNCAAIPPTLAEAMLFGAKKGAFSGADRDTEGLFPAADHGTLFLDEIGELDLALQAKLLRVLETREVLAVGASKSRAIDVRVVSASHRDLKALVSQGKFREDLYFRIGRPEVSLPPLRDRPEEIAALVTRAAASIDPARLVDASLLEVCLTRPWPGNVRELLVEVRHAAQLARASEAPRVTAAFLDADAGTFVEPTVQVEPDARAIEPAELTTEMPSKDEILGALRRSQGKVAAAARLLGIARIRLRRWVEREGLDPAHFK
jgi:transcriptional regulator of acetoin/glycerol metabolism